MISKYLSIVSLSRFQIFFFEIVQCLIPVGNKFVICLHITKIPNTLTKVVKRNVSFSATRVHSFSGSRETGHVRSRSLPSAVPKVVSLLSDLHTVLQKCDDKEALKQTIPRDVMTGVQHWLIPSPDDYRSSKVRIQQLSQQIYCLSCMVCYF